MPVEWPIAASAADHPVVTARPAGRDRLSAVRADFFLDDKDRLTEQERALMSAMLGALIDQLVDELALGLPAVVADQLQMTREGLLSRLWARGALDRPGLVGLLLRRSDEQRLSSNGRMGPVEMLVGDDDEAIAAAAMALTVARGRRRDRFGRLGIDFDDLPADEAVAVTSLIAAAMRVGLGDIGARHDNAMADAATALLRRHDDGNRLDARVAALALALVDSGRADDALVTTLAEAGETALLSAVLSARAAIDPATGWLMLVEQGAECAMLLARLAALTRPAAARMLVAIGPMLAISDPAEAIADFDAISAQELESERQWLRLPRPYRKALERLGASRG